MGRAQVRTIVAAYLTDEIVGLASVYTATPRIIPGTAFTAGMPAGTITGAIAAVHIDNSSDVRIAIGGFHGGQKMVTHDVCLYVRVHSRERDAEAAQAAADVIIDAIVARLRYDHTLGSPTVVFQAGEGKPDLRVQSDLMRADEANSLWQYCEIRFTVQEVVNA